jgi:hypothetical protein
MASIGKIFRRDDSGEATGAPISVVFDLTVGHISGWDDPEFDSDFARNNLGNAFILVSTDLVSALEIVFVSERGHFRITQARTA